MIPRLLTAAAAFAAAAAASPAMAQDLPLSLEQRMLLRCSAAFAIVADEQHRGVTSAAAYPPLGVRGREYFVRAGARLMDELQVTRAEVAARLKSEVELLQAGAMEADDPGAFVAGVMRPCLSALDASGL